MTLCWHLRFRILMHLILFIYMHLILFIHYIVYDNRILSNYQYLSIILLLLNFVFIIIWYNVYCELYIKACILHSVHCTLYNVQCIVYMYTIQYTMHGEHWAQCSYSCTLYIVHGTLYNQHSTMYGEVCVYNMLCLLRGLEVVVIG